MYGKEGIIRSVPELFAEASESARVLVVIKLEGDHPLELEWKAEDANLRHRVACLT